MPEAALKTPLPTVLELLREQFGHAKLTQAFDHQVFVPSPVATERGTQWLKTTNCVGVNVRTIAHFWHLVPYAMTLPRAQNAVHILPIWEAGVAASLYGPASWNINPEYFSPELQAHFPHLDTVEKQLKAVVNVLHLLDKAVGMDVVPHTDRFSEMALANPQHFEWLVRDGLKIKDHRANLHEKAQATILEYLQYWGRAVADVPYPKNASEFFGRDFPETERLRVIFGEKDDYEGRLARRKELVNLFYQLGLETVPATMGPPYRGIEVDPNPEAKTVDEDGREWRDYRITKPQKFSRVFGPLARYKLYEVKNDNTDWELDFAQPRRETWEYVCENYARVQAEFGFDFMRGDMSHVQMRPAGVPPGAGSDPFYDILGAVKKHVLRSVPTFGYFAESFLAPPGEMAYGDECDHLEASHADSTLGDLQSEPVGTQLFMRSFAQYRAWLDACDFAPNFTVMTADKDDPRFDGFYLTGNELRFFMAVFLTDMPSYMGLGFECRDPHPRPAPNEHYTKLYVFQMGEGPKATSGPFVWGKNRSLYQNIVHIKQFSNAIFDKISGQKLEWLLAPDLIGEEKLLAWTQVNAAPEFVFVANLDTENDCTDVKIPVPKTWVGDKTAKVFSTEPGEVSRANLVIDNGLCVLGKVRRGEGLVLMRP